MTIAPRSTGVTRFVLVRHGEPEAWAQGRCCGRLDPGLSPTGLAQAAEVASALADVGIGAVIASPSRRAIETARPTASRLGLPITTMPQLMEIDFGRMEGLTFDEAALRFPDTCRIWVERPWDVAFPGGESFDALRARVLAARDEIIRLHPACTVAVFAHAGPIRLLVAAGSGISANESFALVQSYAGISLMDEPGSVLPDC